MRGRYKAGGAQAALLIVTMLRLPGLLLLLSLGSVCCPPGALSALPLASRRGPPGRAQPRPTALYQTRYFPQKIDHFGFEQDLTFQQRYLVADQHWRKDNGSILFYTGNEGDITWFCNNTDSKHLNYLTSEQALADFAILVQHLKETIPGALNAPVIAIGGSYGGMLAAWFRMKYPHVVVGALAASAPIWQFEDLVPCGTFYSIVTNDFKKSGQCCSESILNSWGAINRISSTDEGLKWLSSAFHLCSPLKSKQDAAVLKAWLIETWVNLAMVNYPYKADFLQPLPAWPIQVVCKFLKNPKLPDKLLLQNVFQAVNVYYNYSGAASCLNTSQSATRNLGLTGWYYQACTEMVMPMCTDGVNDMFEPRKWNFHVFSEECFKLWKVRPRPSWIPSVYGGKNISSHSNIIFSNGGLDPWSGGGVTRNITDSLIAIVIPEGAHHLDLRASNPGDPKSVLQARALEVQYMKQWIEKSRHKH
ncbi:lysosomal Pro-X carboxypeptidase isoform X2 [Terrapene carolina triunguis]|uniref:lysosomal Pro-X carboxypeptidase isoform X2 n=1 Tax=Terrapene triunguis TaxID=2587831 RepID=UPI000CEF99ED|nr:lysosomal Pro-X carboxypeptidase isoform X2 [Terrapene carolina triunguis]